MTSASSFLVLLGRVPGDQAELPTVAVLLRGRCLAGAHSRRWIAADTCSARWAASLFSPYSPLSVRATSSMSRRRMASCVPIEPPKYSVANPPLKSLMTVHLQQRGIDRLELQDRDDHASRRAN